MWHAWLRTEVLTGIWGGNAKEGGHVEDVVGMW